MFTSQSSRSCVCWCSVLIVSRSLKSTKVHVTRLTNQALYGMVFHGRA